MRLGRFAAAFLLVAALAAEPAGAQGGPAGHGVGTDVHVEGDTIVITVQMDVLIRRGMLDASVQQDLADQLDAAADYWNRGMQDFRYFDCLKLRIEVEPRFLHPVNRDFDAPGHVIATYGSSHVGTMADGRGLPSMFDAQGLPDPTSDYAGPFERQVTGYWPPWLFQDTSALAHELGHMFGLGDDYARDENGDVAPLEGRDGTLMDSGDAIDSLLAERIGGNAIEAGYVDQFPACWTGSARLQLSKDYLAEQAGLPRAECRGAWDVAIRFVTGVDGAVDGEALATLASGPRCTFEFPGSATEISFDVTGTASADRLELRFPQTGIDPPGDWVGMQGAMAGTFVVDRTSPTHAEATIAISTTEAGPFPVTGQARISLDCPFCPTG